MKILMLLVILGLTFIYNPYTKYGFVYLNNSSDNYIILVDEKTNVLRYYRALPSGEQRLDLGVDAWLKDKLEKGLPFSGVISPFQGSKKRGLHD